MTTNPKYLISSCLIGKKCRYNGTDRAQDFLVELKLRGEVIDVCPEELGDLSTPRPPAEIRGSEVVTQEALPVTNNYKLGAERALNLISGLPIERAFLKSKSPMCGCGQIYDGSFTGTLKTGDGIFTRILKQNLNIPIESVD
jgi:uncharacterized protein YbbK (DUF523 family)